MPYASYRQLTPQERILPAALNGLADFAGGDGRRVGWREPGGVGVDEEELRLRGESEQRAALGAEFAKMNRVPAESRSTASRRAPRPSATRPRE